MCLYALVDLVHVLEAGSKGALAGIFGRVCLREESRLKDVHTVGGSAATWQSLATSRVSIPYRVASEGLWIGGPGEQVRQTAGGSFRLGSAGVGGAYDVRDAVARRARPGAGWVTGSWRAKDGVERGLPGEEPFGGAGRGGASAKWGGAAWGRSLSEEKRPWVARSRRRVAPGGAAGLR